MRQRRQFTTLKVVRTMSNVSSIPNRHPNHNAVKVLLAGFAEDEVLKASRLLSSVGWDVVSFGDHEEAIAALNSDWFDLTLVDIDNIDIFAPLFIARLRNGTGASRQCTILAIHEFVTEELTNQLLLAGADQILRKPSDPMTYVALLMRLSTQRLKTLAVTVPATGNDASNPTDQFLDDEEASTPQRSDTLPEPQHPTAICDGSVDGKILQTRAMDIVAHFADGEFAYIADRCLFPVVVYVGPQIMVMHDEDRLFEVLGAYRSILSRSGLTEITSRVVHAKEDRPDELVINVENNYFSAAGELIDTGKITYFCVNKQSCPKISVVEYVKWPLPSEVAKDGILSSMLR